MQLGKFRIALIGQTNVGKSKLFNRLTGTRDALVFDRYGVTRDIKERAVDIYEKSAILLDTPGMFDKTLKEDGKCVADAITKKLKAVINSTDLILFIVDGKLGITNTDKEIAHLLHRSGKEIITVINKSESRSTEQTYYNAMAFGFNDIVRISAEHGFGIEELYDVINKYIPETFVNETFVDKEHEDIIKLAIVGRPNVGKSTIVNVLLNEEKQLVADYYGVTRESSSSDFEYNGRNIQIIDTPGIRRKSKITDVLEKISVANAKSSYRKADAVILVIDATTLKAGEIERQDLTLASDIINSGKALVIAFNKYDKTPYSKNSKPEFLKRNFRNSLSQLKDVPFVFTSAINNDNIADVMRMIIASYDKQAKKIKTSQLNDWLSKINKSELLQSGSARFKLKFISQVGSVPPIFLIFVSNKKNIREDHERYIVNTLRSDFNLKDVALRIIFREQKK